LPPQKQRPARDHSKAQIFQQATIKEAQTINDSVFSLQCGREPSNLRLHPDKLFPQTVHFPQDRLDLLRQPTVPAGTTLAPLLSDMLIDA
jgi:hypothetical protein